MKMKWASYPYILWMIVFIVVPLALILLFALTTGEEGIGNLHFTLENFFRFLDPKYIDVLWISISLALKSTFITLILGYPMAMIIAKEKPNRRNIMILLFVIPMWMNFLLRTYAWLTLLGKNGFNLQ